MSQPYNIRTIPLTLRQGIPGPDDGRRRGYLIRHSERSAGVHGRDRWRALSPLAGRPERGAVGQSPPERADRVPHRPRLSCCKPAGAELSTAVIRFPPFSHPLDYRRCRVPLPDLSSPRTPCRCPGVRALWGAQESVKSLGSGLDLAVPDLALDERASDPSAARDPAVVNLVGPPCQTTACKQW